MSIVDRTMSYASGGGPQEAAFIAPYLVISIECSRPLIPSERLSLAEVDTVHIGRGGERTHVRGSEHGDSVLRIEVPDVWMSTSHAALELRDGVWFARDDGSKNGTFVNGAPVGARPLDDGDIVEAGSTMFLFRNRVLRRYDEPADVDAAALAARHPGLATLSIPLTRELDRLQAFAPSSVPLVLLGETGTGKEVIARMVHALSGRRGSFVAVNCSALPDSLVESELFGHTKGAFSGATGDRLGHVRAAHGGTLLLDEIGELPESAQAKLLRVLQESEVVPVGATTPVPVDLRVIAATHRDLDAMIAAGAFRSDLYARLAGAVFTLPPLRERREDIGTLIAALLPRVGGSTAQFERDAARELLTRNWPLNIRQLEQVLRAAVALAGTEAIAMEHLPQAPSTGQQPSGAAQGLDASEEALRDELTRLLHAHSGNVSAVARDMGKARVQIRRWCKRFGLEPESFRH